MYPKNDLHKLFKKYSSCEDFSRRLPNIVKDFTLYNINKAVNCCEKLDSFLDIGAGSGHYSLPLLYKFKKGVAVVPSQNTALEKLKNKFQNLAVKNDYIQNVSFGEIFDFILMVDVFEHIPQNDMDSFLDTLSSLQKKGGVVYLLTPNVFFCGSAPESEVYYKKHKDGHHKHYTKEELVNLFSLKGYELIFVSYEEHDLRRKFDRIYRGLSRRDKKISDNKILNLLSFPLFFPIKLLLEGFNLLVVRDELARVNNEDKAMSVALIFKKIK